MIAPARQNVQFAVQDSAAESVESSVLDTKALILQPNAPVREYSSGMGRESNAVKFGQFKLLVSEIEFFTLYWDPIQHPNPICIYVGALPGQHTNILAQLFPQITFHLYDTQSAAPSLRERSNIQIYQRYFTDAEVAVYKDVPSLFFISDIRSLQYQQGGAYKATLANEERAWNDMRLQEGWVKALRPVWSLLKFRLPYDFPEVRAKIGPTWRYLDGMIYFQQWTGRESAEARLVVPQDWSEKDYDYGQYERMMAHHNAVTRNAKVYRNPFNPNSSDHIDTDHGYTNDYDSVATALIIKLYLEKVGVRPTLEKGILLLSEIAQNVSGDGRRTLRTMRLPGSQEADDE